mmetsp:Transcript_31063/g.52560  ORF Transcript_31063/g.52560 Transcript_31063/m.52560 type:complete len:308 (-) Transcript_31063:1026-1949(-)
MCRLEFCISLKMSENHAEVYGRMFSKAVEFMREVFGVIPKEYRDEADIEEAPVKQVSENETHVKVSLKLVKAKYCYKNVCKILKEALNMWESTTQLPKGVYKGGSPTVTEGCIKVSQFFKMGAEAKASEMLEWIFDEEKHLMSTLTFNGEAVTEPDIEYISANQANKSGIPNKVWFVFPKATEQLIRRVDSFLQQHPCLEQQPYRHDSFPNVELQQIKKVLLMTMPSHRSLMDDEFFKQQQREREQGGDISISELVLQEEDEDDMDCDQNIDNSKNKSDDKTNISNNIGLLFSPPVFPTPTATNVIL